MTDSSIWSASSATLSPIHASGRPVTPSLELQCPVCRQRLRRSFSLPQPGCVACGFTIYEVNGIWHALPPFRESSFRRFVQEYETVRAQEGRGSSSADYYLALPFDDLTGRNVWQWQIRARTFRFLEKNLLRKIELSCPMGCDVLDVGAGNGWLSYRLAMRGHRPVAVDLLDNDTDGLAAARHYFPRLAHSFPRFKAEMDSLPFSGAQFDIVIFNASFHYSVNYQRTLKEARRCLRPGGHLIIADSPFYRREESGQEMLQEKRATFERRFGFRSDSTPSCEYLTPAILSDLATKLALEWNTYRPWYGINWALRPVKARLMRRREPSKFYLLHARMES